MLIVKFIYSLLSLKNLILIFRILENIFGFLHNCALGVAECLIHIETWKGKQGE